MKLTVAEIMKLKSSVETLQKYVASVEQYDANCRELTGAGVKFAIRNLDELSDKLLTVEVKVS